MANFVSELNSLDFSKYIGGPMQAAVDAQNSASMAQVNFIKEVGLYTLPEEASNDDSPTMSNDVRMVEFKYQSVENGVNVNKVLTVPFLTLVSVPALRITEMEIDFNCKLNSVESTTDEKDFSIGGSLKLDVWKVKLNVSASYKQKHSATEQVERTYSLSVHVKIENDEMPAGLDRVLSILESEIKSTSTPVTETSTPGTSEPGQGDANP